MGTDSAYSVGELARLSGVTVRTLHHYDAIGLLTPSDRTAAGYRMYSTADARRDELDRQRETLRRALEAWQMGINLDPDEMLEVFGEHDPTQHAQEAEERWGQTDAHRESHRRTSSYTKQDWQRLGTESEAIEAELAACRSAGEPAEGVRAKAAAEAHRRHIDTWFYPCPHEVQVGLAEMYVQDARFRRHYDDVQPGLADYVRDAITANALDHIA